MFGFLRKNRPELRSLERRYRRLLEDARDLQRNGDIQGYAAKTAEAEAVGRELEAARAREDS